MRGITPAQRRKIFALAALYGLDDELLHSLVQAETKKKHIRDLTIMEAVKVIDRIEGKKQSENPGREQMTYRQRKYMFDLCIALGWKRADGTPDETRLNGFCKARYNCPTYKWLTRRMAGKVIEGLKALRSREEASG